MEATQDLNERRLADAWAELQTHANEGLPLQADAYRLAFADPEFLLRRETRGIRFQLEMLKPDLAQRDAGIENTIVVFGSARFRETSEAQALLDQAEASGDAQAIDRAKKLLRNAPYYDHAREFARKQLADALFEGLWLRYQANRDLSRQTPYVAEAEHFARRALQNIALSYLMLSGKPEVLAATLEQFEHCDNMTERLTALAVLVNSPFEEQKAEALASFAEHFKANPLVMDQWFSVQAGSTLPGGLERVKTLMQHPAFTIKNPNKVRALIGAFAGQNLINFHAADGSGYRFLADLVIELNALNPQIASRQLAPLTRWRKYDAARQALMKGELERILASGELSSDVYEVVSKSLA